MGLVETDGVITREVKYGESSRILTIITRDFGRISALASNVRTNKSGLLAGTQLFCYNHFTFFKGREKSLYKINEAKIQEPFKELRESLDQMAYASYFCDVTNFFVPENSPDLEQLSLLLNTLFMLSRDKISYTKIKAVFEFRTLAIAGYTPNAEACQNCSATEEIAFLNLKEGTALCKDCGVGLKNLIRVNRSVLNAIAYISGIESKRMYSFDLPEDALEYLSKIGEEYLRMQAEHEFKTLDYLKKVIALG